MYSVLLINSPVTQQSMSLNKGSVHAHVDVHIYAREESLEAVWVEFTKAGYTLQTALANNVERCQHIDTGTYVYLLFKPTT